MIRDEIETQTIDEIPIWELDIEEVTGESLEAKNREEVNKLLSEGWILLHIYTLKYKEEEVWRERPMAIFGRPRMQEDLKQHRRSMH